MRRAAFILLSIASVLTLALWFSSHIWILSVYLPGASANSVITIESSVGRITIMISHYSPTPPQDRGPTVEVVSVAEMRQKIETVRMVGIMMDPLDGMSGFEWSTFAFPPHRGVTWSGRRITGPHWLALVIVSGWPALALIRTARRWRQPGYCHRCGYDLRGNPQARACPECGEAVDANRPALFVRIRSGADRLLSRSRIDRCAAFGVAMLILCLVGYTAAALLVVAADRVWADPASMFVLESLDTPGLWVVYLVICTALLGAYVRWRVRRRSRTSV